MAAGSACHPRLSLHARRGARHGRRVPEGARTGAVPAAPPEPKRRLVTPTVDCVRRRAGACLRPLVRAANFLTPAAHPPRGGYAGPAATPDRPSFPSVRVSDDMRRCSGRAVRGVGSTVPSPTGQATRCSPVASARSPSRTSSCEACRRLAATNCLKHHIPDSYVVAYPPSSALGKIVAILQLASDQLEGVIPCKR
jgi:hypothetical protein